MTDEGETPKITKQPIKLIDLPPDATKLHPKICPIKKAIKPITYRIPKRIKELAVPKHKPAPWPKKVWPIKPTNIKASTLNYEASGKITELAKPKTYKRPPKRPSTGKFSNEAWLNKIALPKKDLMLPPKIFGRITPSILNFNANERLIELSQVPKKWLGLPKLRVLGKIRKCALTYNATPRIADLAKPKPLHKDDAELPEGWVITMKSLNYKATKRIKSLAKPKSNKNTEKETDWSVSKNALKYKASPRIKELSKPKVMRIPKGMEGEGNEIHAPETRSFGISIKALKYKATKRIKQLAEPNIRKEEQRKSRKISENALKYRPTKRIIRLAQPKLQFIEIFDPVEMKFKLIPIEIRKVGKAAEKETQIEEEEKPKQKSSDKPSKRITVLAIPKKVITKINDRKKNKNAPKYEFAEIPQVRSEEEKKKREIEENKWKEPAKKSKVQASGRTKELAEPKKTITKINEGKTKPKYVRGEIPKVGKEEEKKKKAMEEKKWKEPPKKTSGQASAKTSELAQPKKIIIKINEGNVKPKYVYAKIPKAGEKKTDEQAKKSYKDPSPRIIQLAKPSKRKMVKKYTYVDKLLIVDPVEDVREFNRKMGVIKKKSKPIHYPPGQIVYQKEEKV